MPRTYTERFKRTINATGASESPLMLLEISHATLDEPARVVNDSQDFPYGMDFMWHAATAYAVDQVLVPTEYNGRYYVCTVAGLSGGAEPVWPATLTDTVANGTATFRCEGNQFRAMAFEGAMPDDLTRQMPRARLEVDNRGRELAELVEASAGGKDASVRMMQALRSDPDTIEWEVTLDMRNMKMTPARISADLGFDDLLSKPAVSVRYDPQTAPGLY